MKKNKEICPAFMFKDQIWKIYDDDSEEMIWENSLHKDMFENDDEPDSEYNKMMELNRKEDFWQNWDEMDYWYEHRYVQVFLTGNNKGTERVVKYESLLEEFANT